MKVTELIKELETLQKEYGDGFEIMTTCNIEAAINTWPLKGISMAQVCIPIETELFTGLAYPLTEDENAFPTIENKIAFPGPEDDKLYGKHAPGCVIVLFP
jgi:hypothetical protein